MKHFFYVLAIIFILFSCSKNPSDRIIEYTQKKYGKNFKEGNVELSEVFKFKWNKLYIFCPLTYPEDIKKETGFRYDGPIVKDDNYLFAFVYDGKIVKSYTYSNIKIGFSDDTTCVYKVGYSNSYFKIKKLGENNYWLTKVHR